jgi:hypothetical protein
VKEVVPDSKISPGPGVCYPCYLFLSLEDMPASSSEVRRRRRRRSGEGRREMACCAGIILACLLSYRTA